MGLWDQQQTVHSRDKMPSLPTHPRSPASEAPEVHLLVEAQLGQRPTGDTVRGKPWQGWRRAQQASNEGEVMGINITGVRAQCAEVCSCSGACHLAFWPLHQVFCETPERLAMNCPSWPLHFWLFVQPASCRAGCAWSSQGSTCKAKGGHTLGSRRNFTNIHQS